MQNIVSADIYVDASVPPYEGKTVHCKLSSETIHITGAKSHAQGARAIDLMISRVHEAQRRLDAFVDSGDRRELYNAYHPEFSIGQVDDMCDHVIETGERLVSSDIKLREVLTANSVNEFSVPFKINLIFLFQEALKLGYSVDFNTWQRSKTASISIRSECGKFYYRALINNKGSVRLSSSCHQELSRIGFLKVLDLIKISRRVELDDLLSFAHAGNPPEGVDLDLITGE